MRKRVRGISALRQVAAPEHGPPRQCIKGITWEMWRCIRYAVEVEGAGKKVRYKELRVRRVVQTKNGIGHNVRSSAVTRKL